MKNLRPIIFRSVSHVFKSKDRLIPEIYPPRYVVGTNDSVLAPIKIELKTTNVQFCTVGSLTFENLFLFFHYQMLRDGGGKAAAENLDEMLLMMQEREMEPSKKCKLLLGSINYTTDNNSTLAQMSEDNRAACRDMIRIACNKYSLEISQEKEIALPARSVYCNGESIEKISRPQLLRDANKGQNSL